MRIGKAPGKSKPMETIDTEIASTSGKESTSPVNIIQAYLKVRQDERKKTAAAIGIRLENAFAFIRKSYEENEMLVFTTSLTENRESARFIITYGSESYYKYNKSLLLDQREANLMNRIQGMEE